MPEHRQVEEVGALADIVISGGIYESLARIGPSGESPDRESSWVASVEFGIRFDHVRPWVGLGSGGAYLCTNWSPTEYACFFRSLGTAFGLDLLPNGHVGMGPMAYQTITWYWEAGARAWWTYPLPFFPALHVGAEVDLLFAVPYGHAVTASAQARVALVPGMIGRGR